jgi:hypothetical protein
LKTDLKSIVEGFENTNLPKEKWTHEAHLAVATWYVKKYNFHDAIIRMRMGILSLNDFHGTANNNISGYHETLTVFWAKVIYFHQDFSEKYFAEELLDELLKSSLSSRNLPFYFYERDLILSTSHRAYFHEPRLKKLDFFTIRDFFKNYTF